MKKIRSPTTKHHKNLFVSITCSDLMSKTTTTTMNHDAYLPLFFDAHLACVEFVVNLIDNLNFCIVVTRPKSSQLQFQQQLQNYKKPHNIYHRNSKQTQNRCISCTLRWHQSAAITTTASSLYSLNK